MSYLLASLMAIACIDSAAPVTMTSAALVVATQDVSDQEDIATDAPSSENDSQNNEVEPDAALTDSDDEPFDEPVVFADETDEAVADRLINYLENIKTLKGDFTQIAPSGAISTGRFFLRRPGFLRFEYDPPTPLLIVANGGLVYVRDEALETTDSYPVGQTPLKFLLQREFDRDEAKVINVDRGVDNIAVTFAPDDDETEGELTLITSAPDFELRRWIVRDLQGGITVVTLDNVIEGEKLSMRLFRAPDTGGRFLDR